MNIPEGLAQYLSTRDIGITYSENVGGNAFIDDLPTLAQATGVTVGFYHVGGLEADLRLPNDVATLQIVVRGTKDPRDAIAMWYHVYSHLVGLSNVTLPNGDYLVSCRVIQAAPVRMGADENARYRYAMNLMVEMMNPTEHRSI